jgi:hypothetical protein
MKSSLYSLILFLPSLLSHVTAISRDSFNYFSAGLGSSLYSNGADPTENTVSIVIAQKYIDCCLFTHYGGNLFTEPLPSNERLLWLRYSGFQASCHNMHIMYILYNLILCYRLIRRN